MLHRELGRGGSNLEDLEDSIPAAGVAEHSLEGVGGLGGHNYKEADSNLMNRMQQCQYNETEQELGSLLTLRRGRLLVVLPGRRLRSGCRSTWVSRAWSRYWLLRTRWWLACSI